MGRVLPKNPIQLEYVIQKFRSNLLPEEIQDLFQRLLLNTFEGEIDDKGHPIFVFGKSGFAIFDLQFNHIETYAL